MRKLLLLSFILTSLSVVNAQKKFAAPSQGFYSNAEPAKLVMIDSTEKTLAYDLESEDPESIPEVFYFLDEKGEKMEVEPAEIRYLEIMRGTEPALEDEEGEEDLDDDEEYEIINVIETTKITEKLIFERVKIDHKKGIAIKPKYREDSYLLQLASVGMGDRLKVYVCPNFEEDGTEAAPLGQEIEGLARNRTDYVAYQKYYYVKLGDQAAFRISDEEFLTLTPIIFGDCRGFRRKFGVKKVMDSESTKKRKKTTRKAVGKKKKKASLIKYEDFARMVKEYHSLYAIQLEENEAKRLAREAEKNESNK